MSEAKPDCVIDLIEHLTKKMIELNEQLKQDREYFKINELASIKQSNLKKEHLNQAILGTFHAIESHPELSVFSGNLFEKLGGYVEARNQSESVLLETLIQRFTDAWNEGHSLIATNNAIVEANLSFSRGLLGQLMGNSSEDKAATYDKSATIR